MSAAILIAARLEALDRGVTLVRCRPLAPIEQLKVIFFELEWRSLSAAREHAASCGECRVVRN